MKSIAYEVSDLASWSTNTTLVLLPLFPSSTLSETAGTCAVAMQINGDRRAREAGATHEDLLHVEGARVLVNIVLDPCWTVPG